MSTLTDHETMTPPASSPDGDVSPKKTRVRRTQAADEKSQIAWRESDDIRHKNFMVLRERFRQMEGPGMPDRGALQRFADFVEIDARYISNVERKLKRIGRRMAHTFEAKFELPAGWLDVDHGEGVIPVDPEAREFAQLAMTLYLENRSGVTNALLKYMHEHQQRKAG
jgi:hypothetical protein